MLLSSSSRPYYDKAGTLYVVGTFASTPVAQEVRTLVREGVIDAMSVAFIDAKSVRRGGVLHITQAELIAVDLVTIPSNREALILSSKSVRSGAPLAWRADLARMEHELLAIELLALEV